MENQNASAVKTEETTTVNTTGVDEDVVIAENDEKKVDSNFTDTVLETDGEGKTDNDATANDDGKKDKPKQSKEDNKKFAEKRRAEKLAKEESELKFVKEYVGNNPYTGEPINTLRDVKVYKTMKQIEKDGGDPVQDYHKYAGREEQTAIDKENARIENIKKDVDDFRTAYPDINLNELNKDESFVKFSNKMLGKVPLKDIYEAYNGIRGSLKSSAEESAKQELAKKMAKDTSSAGNLSSSGDAGAPKYTMEQIGKMSKAQMNENWKDVEASYDYWQKHPRK